MTTDPPRFGLDLYNAQVRLAPAALAAAPALAAGIAALPLLPGAQKLWGLVSVGLVTFATLSARRHGNRVQPHLWVAWGGTPTTDRLRFRSNPDAAEVARRHREVARVLGDGLTLPTASDEAADPRAADAAYTSAVRRLIALTRNQPQHRLLNVENRQYGFARNLCGLKPFGLWCAAIVAAGSLLVGAAVTANDAWRGSAPLLLPICVSIFALLAWRQVTPDFVRPSADAYADRLLEAVEQLPSP